MAHASQLGKDHVDHLQRTKYRGDHKFLQVFHCHCRQIEIMEIPAFYQELFKSFENVKGEENEISKKIIGILDSQIKKLFEGGKSEKKIFFNKSLNSKNLF